MQQADDWLGVPQVHRQMASWGMGGGKMERKGLYRYLVRKQAGNRESSMQPIFLPTAGDCP